MQQGCSRVAAGLAAGNDPGGEHKLSPVATRLGTVSGNAWAGGREGRVVRRIEYNCWRLPRSRRLLGKFALREYGGGANRLELHYAVCVARDPNGGIRTVGSERWDPSGGIRTEGSERWDPNGGYRTHATGIKTVRASESAPGSSSMQTARDTSNGSA